MVPFINTVFKEQWNGYEGIQIVYNANTLLQI